MNIFYLDENPELAAKSLGDKHVVKMVLETAQLLSQAHGDKGPYKPTHVNHPCAVWVRESIFNYLWLCSYGIELAWEYEERYGRKHKSSDVISWCYFNRPDYNYFDKTPNALAMPDEFKTDNPVDSYRDYYFHRKYLTGIARYFRAEEPDWLKQMKQDYENLAYEIRCNDSYS